MAFFAADRASLRFPHFPRDAKQAGKCRINFLTFSYKLFHPCDVMVDIRWCTHLLSSVAMLKVPPKRCHGSSKSCGMLNCFDGLARSVPAYNV
jgi:hypothetical protein